MSSNGCVECAKLHAGERVKSGRGARSATKYRNSIHGRADKLFRGARDRALKIGVEFSLTREWILARMEAGVCEVTGLPFSYDQSSESHRVPWAPSLDRVDNRSGYTWWNTKVVVWAYNAAKGEWHHTDVMRLAHALVRQEARQLETKCAS